MQGNFDWCFTAQIDNNFNINDWFDDRTKGTKWTPMFLCVGDEVAPTTGQRHIQGFVQLKKKDTRGNTIKRLKLKGPHLEPCKGTPQQNYDYCIKEGSWREFGIMNKGVRNRVYYMSLTNLLDLYCAANEEEKKVLMVTHRQHFVMNGDKIKKYMESIEEPYVRTKKPIVTWIWGPAGTGKSKMAWDFDKELYVWHLAKDHWQDLYNGQKTILIDDFRGQVHIDFTNLLRMLDHYPNYFSRRGVKPIGNKAEFIFITSDRPFTEAYSGQGDIDQLGRRIDRHVYIGEDGQVTEGMTERPVFHFNVKEYK